MRNHLRRSLERAALVLQPDLDQLKRRDHHGLGRSCRSTSEDGEGLSGGDLPVLGEDGSPVACGGDIRVIRGSDIDELMLNVDMWKGIM